MLSLSLSEFRFSYPSSSPEERGGWGGGGPIFSQRIYILGTDKKAKEFLFIYEEVASLTLLYKKEKFPQLSGEYLIDNFVMEKSSFSVGLRWLFVRNEETFCQRWRLPPGIK
jgi:hypothetical protein